MEFNKELIRKGVEPYLKIMSMVDTNSFCSHSFKTLFNGFYRVRQRPSTWYASFYDLFKKCKSKPMTFEELLTEMFEKTQRIEPSFCSKLIATLNPNKPIWDKYVLQWLGFTKNNEPKDKKEKIKYFASIYEAIENEYLIHFSDPNIIESMKKLESDVPETKGMTKAKKLDFMLWSNRSDRVVSILDYDLLLNSKQQ